jgi:hypothetical protein
MLNGTFGSDSRRGLPIYYYGTFERFAVGYFGWISAYFSKRQRTFLQKMAFHSGTGIASPTHNFSRYEEKDLGPSPCSVLVALCKFLIGYWKIC